MNGQFKVCDVLYAVCIKALSAIFLHIKKGRKQAIFHKRNIAKMRQKIITFTFPL
jgi:hypothetical protein